MSDEASDSVKPWTVRGIPPEERNAATEAAKRAGMTLGEWLQRAIRGEIQRERSSDRAPVPVGQVADVAGIAAALRELAAAGVPIAKSHAARLTAALVDPLPKPTPAVRRKRGDSPTDGGAKSDNGPAEDA